MSLAETEHFKQRLTAKLAGSLSDAMPEGTPRTVWGRVSLPGKATAVIGMRRAGKTMFLHQLRRERSQNGRHREWLPYLNFEDEQFAGLEAGQLHLVVEEYYRLYPALRASG